MKIVKIFTLTMWTLWCIIGIIGNFSHYKLDDWIFIIPFISMPYLILRFVSYKFKKNNKETCNSNNVSIKKEIKFDSTPKQQTQCNKINDTIYQTVEQTTSENLSKEKRFPFQENSYKNANINNAVRKADYAIIPDKKIPYPVYDGYIKALQEERSSPNPKFHRTYHEENLSFNFEMKYGNKIDILTNKFEILYDSASKTNDLDKKIYLLKETIKAFEKAKNFCYSKGKGGIIYFQDMWEYLHNSHNNCFSYLDSIQNDLQYSIYLKEEVIPKIIETIKNNDGLLQKDIYNILPNISKSLIQRTIRQLESDNIILRHKKGSTYELHILAI